MNLFKRLCSGITLVAGLAASTSAVAVPIKWTLDNVTFAGGGGASGSFLYDPGTNSYSGISIVTTAPGGTTRATYGASAVVVGTPSDDFLLTVEDLTIPSYVLLLAFESPLTAGGVAALDVSAPAPLSFEFQCLASGCFTNASSRTSFRFVSGGSVVPEPGSLALLGLGLAGLGVIRRRNH